MADKIFSCFGDVVHGNIEPEVNKNQHHYGNNADNRSVQEICDEKVPSTIADGKTKQGQHDGVKPDFTRKADICQHTADKTERHCNRFAFKHRNAESNREQKHRLTAENLGQKVRGAS